MTALLGQSKAVGKTICLSTVSLSLGCERRALSRVAAHHVRFIVDCRPSLPTLRFLRPPTLNVRNGHWAVSPISAIP
jgi:hypothetical protein